MNCQNNFNRKTFQLRELPIKKQNRKLDMMENMILFAANLDYRRRKGRRDASLRQADKPSRGTRATRLLDTATRIGWLVAATLIAFILGMAVAYTQQP